MVHDHFNNPRNVGSLDKEDYDYDEAEDNVGARSY